MGISIEGRVTVGGQVINPVAFRRNIAYVMQDDALLATATPREALLFSANMRLPGSYTEERIHALVEQLLEELGIANCADVMIGGAMIKGISGGQRKRTSVGVELVTDPSLLFLDEPTTGLDSFSAFNLIKLLKVVAKRDCTVLCTIHQPSSEVFFLFDRVIFMKDGRVFYQGPSQGATKHFTTFSYHCPPNYNPSDYIMTLCHIPEAEATAKGMYMPSPEEEVGPKSSRLDSEVTFQVERSMLRQISALTFREATNTYRDVAALIGRFGVTAFLNLLFGLIFLGVGGKDNGDSSAFNNHFGAITMVLISSMFGSAQPIMLSFPFERPMFMREYSTGTCKPFPFTCMLSWVLTVHADGSVAYFLSKIIVELPLTFMQTLLAFILSYFMLDLQGSFIFIVLAAWGLGLASSSVAVLLGCSLADVKQVTEMAPLMFVPQMLFVGFFVRTSQIPIFLRWAQYLCSLKYAMNLIMVTEFSLSNESCQTSDEARDNCHGLLQANDVDVDSYWVYILIIIALIVSFRLVAGAVLVQKAKRFY